MALLKLYDADPPLPYLMHLVHESIVNSMTPQECDDLRDTGVVERHVTMPVLRKVMEERCGCPQKGAGLPEIPKWTWLVEALEAFIKLGWAEKGTGSAEYVYTVKHRRQVMEQFLAHCADLKIAEITKKQRQQIEPTLASDWVAPALGSDLLTIAESTGD